MKSCQIAILSVPVLPLPPAENWMVSCITFNVKARFVPNHDTVFGLCKQLISRPLLGSSSGGIGVVDGVGGVRVLQSRQWPQGRANSEWPGQELKPSTRDPAAGRNCGRRMKTSSRFCMRLIPATYASRFVRHEAAISRSSVVSSEAGSGRRNICSGIISWWSRTV